MELRVLRYFLAVAREESISGAAKYLHLSQPSLSRQLMELERELGKELFIRGNRRITLTEEGELLRKRAGEIILLVEKTESELSGTEETVGGEVFIGGGETQAMRLVARCARKLRQTSPDMRFHLYSGNGDDVSEKLDKGLLDFGLLIEPFDKKKFDFIKLPVKDRWGVLMPGDCPLARKESVSPRDLWELPLIISRQSMLLGEMPGWMEKPLDELNIAGTYNLIFNASLMVAEGVGYALCLDRLVNTYENGSLCFRPLVPAQEVGIAIVWKKYQVFSRAAERFLESIRLMKDDGDDGEK